MISFFFLPVFLSQFLNYFFQKILLPFSESSNDFSCTFWISKSYSSIDFRGARFEFFFFLLHFVTLSRNILILLYFQLSRYQIPNAFSQMKVFRSMETFLQGVLYKINYLPKSCTSQKQLTEVLCKKLCSQKFLKIHRKSPVPEPLLLNKVAGIILQLY